MYYLLECQSEAIYRIMECANNFFNNINVFIFKFFGAFGANNIFMMGVFYF